MERTAGECLAANTFPVDPVERLLSGQDSVGYEFKPDHTRHADDSDPAGTHRQHSATGPFPLKRLRLRSLDRIVGHVPSG